MQRSHVGRAVLALGHRGGPDHLEELLRGHLDHRQLRILVQARVRLYAALDLVVDRNDLPVQVELRDLVLRQLFNYFLLIKELSGRNGKFFVESLKLFLPPFVSSTVCFRTWFTNACSGW